MHNYWKWLSKRIYNTSDVQALQVHGTADTVTPYDPVAISSNTVMNTFMTNLEFKVYQGLGHDMIQEEILYIKAFLDRILATNQWYIECALCLIIQLSFVFHFYRIEIQYITPF